MTHTQNIAFLRATARLLQFGSPMAIDKSRTATAKYLAEIADEYERLAAETVEIEVKGTVT